MPTASRNERRKRRIRRNLTLATRNLRTETMQRARVQVALLAVLAARGGEIEITQADITGTVQNLQHIGYVIEKKLPDNPADTTFVVKLVAVTEGASQPVAEEAPVAEEIDSDPVHVQMATVLGDCEQGD